MCPRIGSDFREPRTWHHHRSRSDEALIERGKGGEIFRVGYGQVIGVEDEQLRICRVSEPNLQCRTSTRSARRQRRIEKRRDHFEHPLRPFHHTKVADAWQYRQLSVGKKPEHLHGMLRPHDVPVADHHQHGNPDPSQISRRKSLPLHRHCPYLRDNARPLPRFWRRFFIIVMELLGNHLRRQTCDSLDDFGLEPIIVVANSDHRQFSNHLGMFDGDLQCYGGAVAPSKEICFLNLELSQKSHGIFSHLRIT